MNKFGSAVFLLAACILPAAAILDIFKWFFSMPVIVDWSGLKVFVVLVNTAIILPVAALTVEHTYGN
jgi:hypothetical protein